MTRPTTKKTWMADVPSTLTTKAHRPGKPIAAPAVVKRTSGMAPTPAIPPRLPARAPAPADARESEEQARRARTRDTHVVQSAETSERMRRRMVDRLAQSGIRNPLVLAAMNHVPRHRFVDQGLVSRAYDDTALPIGHAQTISQPYVVARMTELALAELPAPPSQARILEIGTGCGYQAAILAKVAGEVYSIERIRALHDRARENLRALRVPNLRLVYGDGLEGIASAAPFDAMLVAAAGDSLPDALLEQVRVGGRVLAPLAVGRGRAGDQTLCLFVRTSRTQWATTLLDAVRFVPLRPGVA